ncbi:transketolase, partial [candidate division KSB1 bacterium]|nr:transketolase [candidate division KSB1 bacterium]
AAQQLNHQGLAVRVVSMPSWELFEAQSQNYKDEVLPPAVKARLAVESGVAQGWHKYIGEQGATLTIDNRYGASAPVAEVMKAYGFSPENIAAKARALLQE